MLRSLSLFDDDHDARTNFLAPALTRFFWRGNFARTNGPAARAHDSCERCAMERCDMEAGMAKYVASKAGIENTLESKRTYGAHGSSKECPVERYFPRRAANELQRMLIARQRVARNPPHPV
jgi:alkylation response protein AidB-like acyl-CoA dehydrogenase